MKGLYVVVAVCFALAAAAVSFPLVLLYIFVSGVLQGIS